uniref:Uncharacterized protein n=1 Tax=Trichuris muris TaxID=70415 RepID=A0A5S6R3E9_TRIMR
MSYGTSLLSIDELVCMCHDEQSAIVFLQERGILHREKTCPWFYRPRLADLPDGGAINRAERSSPFAQELGSRIPMCILLRFMYYWSREWSNMRDVEEQLGLNHSSVVAWNLAMREAVAETLVTNQVPVGGPGLTVQVDETVLPTAMGLRRCVHANRGLLHDARA